MGYFQFRVLLFELQGAPAVFMQLINEILQKHHYKGIFMHLDDILIFTKTREEHAKLVRAVLNKLWAAQLYAKLSKCEFRKKRTNYLGYHMG